jgi:hypothetical protein
MLGGDPAISDGGRREEKRVERYTSALVPDHEAIELSRKKEKIACPAFPCSQLKI